MIRRASKENGTASEKHQRPFLTQTTAPLPPGWTTRTSLGLAASLVEQEGAPDPVTAAPPPCSGLRRWASSSFFVDERGRRVLSRTKRPLASASVLALWPVAERDSDALRCGSRHAKRAGTAEASQGPPRPLILPVYRGH